MFEKKLSQKKAKSVALDFVNYIKNKHGLKIEKAYLFGSYAKNKQHDWSDIDVCIVSNDFKSKKWDAIGYLAHKKRDIDVKYGIEALGILPEDFVEFNPIANEVMKYGIEL